MNNAQNLTRILGPAIPGLHRLWGILFFVLRVHSHDTSFERFKVESFGTVGTLSKIITTIWGC